ncbi:MAG: chorismate synthase [Candidatus Cloacimonetes bacterium]|nr:chorismate synthase [Candidatus Cloacimonadota bacterium]
MKANSLEKYYGITAFGESHGKAIGVVIEDVKANQEFPLKEIQNALNERKPGSGKFTSPRKEDDRVEVISGVYNGKTTGMPICLLVYNKDARQQDYKHLQNLFRPGHSDFSYYKKFKIFDHRGGGRSSGRETISRVAASGMVQNILKGIKIDIYTVKIGKFETINYSNRYKNELYWPNEESYNDLVTYLEEIKRSGDSIGGVVEVMIKDLPAGLGDPVFEKLDANLAKAILSIGGVKGIEFGNGFDFAALKGSQGNDQISKTGFITNHNGGIIGGISTGNDLVFRFVVKPTPSISMKQNTVTKENEEIKFKTKGRHDTCIIPRIIPVAKAMIHLVMSDAISHQKLISDDKIDLADYREAIDKIDEDILIGLYRRMEISSLIGKFKQQNKLPIEDENREQELLKKLKLKASSFKIDESFIEEIWVKIISESKIKQ